MSSDSIISNPDAETVYDVPLIFNQQTLDSKIQEKLGLSVQKTKLYEWRKLVKRIKSPKKKTVEIAIVGKYFGTGDYQIRDSYAALFDALDHASWYRGVYLDTKWIDAEKVEQEGIEKIIGRPDGIIVPIGWGPRGAEGMIQAASYARKHKIPYLGLCYGMQLAVVAFARDVLGWKDADTTENTSNTKHPTIHIIPSQKEKLKRRAYGGSMRLGAWDAKVKKGTLAYKFYNEFAELDRKTGLTSERHRHRYEFNNKYAKDFEAKGLVIAARSKVEGLVEIIELPESSHPFYLGTQGHPEYKSRPLKPHPFFVEYLRACATS